jgi:Helicase conserved C-terminal domain
MHNVKVGDLRVRSFEGRPARPLVSCDSLLELVRDVSLDPDRDFFVRMSSFSLSSGSTSDSWQQLRDELRELLPWLRDEAFDLRRKETFKRSFAQALCCALPRFDLVIVDEAHNLKHGFAKATSARNQVLAAVLGRHAPSEAPDPRFFPGYGMRAARVLFLSATPLEDSYEDLWNQLDLFGLANGFDALRDPEVSEREKKQLAAQFLIRRVTSLRVGNREHTKNMYRREWRAGGVAEHDQPTTVSDPRQRLLVALVQKKVSEVLRGKQFNRRFQIGMLASFESFLVTAKLKHGEEEQGVFDDQEQTELAAEREGLDVRDLNKLARSYRKAFEEEMPHPKMDALVERLASAWETGEKALVFVRRVASVKELKRKLDERYDAWLIPHLRGRLPERLRKEFDDVVARYHRERRVADASKNMDATAFGEEPGEEERSGVDTFFSWFCHGEGPKKVLSAANFKGLFVRGGRYDTFFTDNHVMELLGCEPGQVLAHLAAALGLSVEATDRELRRLAAQYLVGEEKKTYRARMDATQAAALELLRKCGPVAERAGMLWDLHYAKLVKSHPRREFSPVIANVLEQVTFFSELRRPERAELRRRIWPEGSPSMKGGLKAQLKEREVRALLLSAAARHGHALLDLYSVAMAEHTTLRSAREREEMEAPELGAGDGRGERLIGAYLDLLEAQAGERGARSWGAFHELSEIAAHFELILDVNLPNAATASLEATASEVTKLTRQQRPVAGMAVEVTPTVVRQFRMPGYPMVLVTTDLLQEGEDLHTFCSSVYHYGISWTSSAMEQRIGRIDRVRSLTDRRLSALEREPEGGDWLQVYFPHLQDTVEVVQVQRVLERMSTFLRLMHDGIAPPPPESRSIDLRREIATPRAVPVEDRQPLRSAFPVTDEAVAGTPRALAIDATQADLLRKRFTKLGESPSRIERVEWATPSTETLLGTARRPDGRGHPFALLLRFDGAMPSIRCISPIGSMDLAQAAAGLVEAATLRPREGARGSKRSSGYNLTVEGDVLLGAPEHDVARVALLIQRVTERADTVKQAHPLGGRDASPGDLMLQLREERGGGW